MKSVTIKHILSVLCLAFLAGSVSGQSPSLIKKESQILISGTSNLHDWHEAAEDFSIEMSLTADEAFLPVIERVILSCRTASIKSDNSIMTNKTLDALRAGLYPEITFTSLKQSALQVRSGGFSSTITGELTINGVKKQVTVPVEGSLTGTTLHVKGGKAIRMSDYQVKAPTALMGSLKTGDEVNVSFDLKFELPSNNVIITALNK
jgi:hypothetical protein